MSQTPEGARRAAATIRARYGADFWSINGRRSARVQQEAGRDYGALAAKGAARRRDLIAAGKRAETEEK
jgi:hypothetical protein